MKLPSRIDMNERLNHYNVAGLSIALINNRQVSKTEGFGIIEKGYINAVNEKSMFNACSISKFATSLLVLKLTEEGLLDLDEDINDRLHSWKLPDGPYYPGNPVTLRALLSHQSGVVDPAGSYYELDHTGYFPTMAELLDGSTSYCKEAATITYEPISDFQYSDTGFCMIQQLIEDVTREPFHLVMNKLIFEPLLLTNSIYQPSISASNSTQFACGHSKDGHVVNSQHPIYPYDAACGLWSTPTDIALLVIEIMNALQGNSRIGLSVHTAKEWMSPQLGKAWTGLGIFLDNTEQALEVSSLGWGVGFQCMLVAYPHLGTGAVIMTNTDSAVHQLEGIIGELYQVLKPQLQEFA
ncbi:serine hydrolase [Paenibacillus sp. L3-i20]|uniref:serine hydrolase domain-containing protein n=1 Tax=Paenibacillus sp. L3-i20 TaxID=2905833 RepID=UPI001EDDEFD0|nr:serine hydrolase domain-containing protein [Paenibacillus sp. L3-i20]GKU77536.1 penicillin-binding protein [Paenibacillus sp. L3-i20]